MPVPNALILLIALVTVPLQSFAQTTNGPHVFTVYNNGSHVIRSILTGGAGEPPYQDANYGELIAPGMSRQITQNGSCDVSIKVTYTDGATQSTADFDTCKHDLSLTY